MARGSFCSSACGDMPMPAYCSQALPCWGPQSHDETFGEVVQSNPGQPNTAHVSDLNRDTDGASWGGGCLCAVCCCMYVCLYVFACANVNQRMSFGCHCSGAIHLGIFICFLSGVSLAWNTPSRLGWPATEPHGSSCLHIPNAGLQACTTPPGLLMQVLRSSPRSS